METTKQIVSNLVNYVKHIRPYFDYGDVFTTNSSILPFIKKLNLSNTTLIDLTLIDLLREIYREKLYQELGSESVQQRRWFNKLVCFYNTSNSEAPFYFYTLILASKIACSARYTIAVPILNFRH